MNKCCCCHKETKSEYSTNKKGNGILCGKCTQEYLENRIEDLEAHIAGLQAVVNQHYKDISQAKQADCKHRFTRINWAVYDNYATYRCQRCEYIKKGKVVDDKKLVKRKKK